MEITDNRITEYDIAYTIGAAWACNHGLVRGNRIGRNIRIENNSLDKGRKIFAYEKHIMNDLLYENAMGFDNKVLAEL